MSMMVNPSDSGQVIAAGKPFKLKLRRKAEAEQEPETAETPAEAPTEQEDGSGDDR